MNRVTWTIIGWLLFLFGFISIILGLIGLNITPLVFIDRMFNPLFAFLIKLILIIAGIIIFYMSRLPQEEE